MNGMIDTHEGARVRGPYGLGEASQLYSASRSRLAEYWCSTIRGGNVRPARHALKTRINVCRPMIQLSTRHSVRWLSLWLIFVGLILIPWAAPQPAVAAFEPTFGVEKSLPYGEGEGEPLIYYEGGSGVQTAPKVYLIFWGSHFETEETGEKVRLMLLKLFEGMSGSAYEGILTQYFNSTGGATGRVSSTVSTTSWIDKSVEAPSNITEAKINEEIEHAISTNQWTSELNSQFVLVTAPGSTYAETTGCAYHYLTPTGIIYDFVPYQGDEPFARECLSLGNPSKNPILKTSKSASHEFAETATDPKGNTWGEDQHEIGDLCVSIADKELPDGAWAQLQYDDHKNECALEDLQPPHLYTLSKLATSITANHATLNAVVNPEAYESQYYFELGTSTSYGTRTTEASSSSAANVSAAQTVCSLTPNTTYDYRIAASNSTGTTYGQNESFKTAESGSSSCPTATTEGVTNLSTTEATLNGTVNPSGLETKYYFEYGTQATYGHKTTEVGAGSGTTNVKVDQVITSLTRSTLLHYRLVAANSAGTSYGADKTFTTPKCPTATTESATGITTSEAIIRGNVNPNGCATTDQFEYGTTTSYGTTVPVTAESAGSGNSAVEKGYILTGLSPNTTYHYRLVATSSQSTSYGSDSSFTTSSLTPTLSSLFGSFGTGNGQFNEPTGISASPISGLVVVSDELNNRIEVFNEKGEYIRQFGTTGTGNGQFKEPRGVAIDAKGNVWVTDTGNNRVEAFSETGVYRNQFGTLGTGNGQLTSPKGIAVDSKGNVWVADSGNKRIEEFSEKGEKSEKYEYLSQFSTGTNPIGVAADPTGNIWSDDENETGEIEEHNEKGELIQQFASRGEGNGQLKEPKRLIVINGFIWVPDAGNNRVEIFNEKGEYITKFGAFGSGAEQMDYPTGVALDPRGNVWIADNNNRVDHWKITSPWPATFSSTFGSTGSGNGQFNEPAGISVDPLNNLLAISDLLNNRVEVFNAKGEYLRKFGTAGTGNGQLKEPEGIAFDAKGNIWVDDTGNNRIEEFSEGGAYVSQFGTAGTGNGQFNLPRSIAIDFKGDMWVADSGNKRVEEFNERGEYLSQFGVGTNPGGVAVDAKGNVWSDDENETGEIEEHNEKGELVQLFAGRGEGNGQLKNPKRLAVANGFIWVPNVNRVEVFNDKGEYVTTFGTVGSGNEQMKTPTAVALDARGNVWITDKNNRVDQWTR